MASIKLLIPFVIFFIGSSCAVNYNFTGSSVPDEAKRIYIGEFYNVSTGGPSTLDQNFNIAIQEYFQRNTKLLIEKKPISNEPSLTGTITNYQVSIAGAGATATREQAATNRLTISVKASYVNPFNEEDNFDKTFSYSAEYEADRNLSEVESQLIEEITDQLVYQIFNACFGTW